MQSSGKVGGITVQNHLAAFQKRHLQIEVMQNLDEGTFKSRYLKTVLDATNESYGINLRTNILQ